MDKLCWFDEVEVERSVYAGEIICVGVWRVYVCECVEIICLCECVRNILCACVFFQLDAASEAGGILDDGLDRDRTTSLRRRG